jgi:hypothetical protein
MLTMSLGTRWLIAILIKVPLIFILTTGFVAGMALIFRNISLALSIAGATVMVTCCAFTIKIFAGLEKLVEDTTKKQNQNS